MNHVVIDLTSVKDVPVRIMHKYIKKNTVLGTHPMFGPYADPKGQNFILTPTTGKETDFALDLADYLRSKGFNTVLLDPKSHDRMISTMLSLTHFVGFVVGTCAGRSFGYTRSW